MQKTKTTTGLIWFRNDLRTHDTIVLNKACSENERVVGVYCFDPRMFQKTPYGFKKTEVFRTTFLLETLHNLKAQLLKLNIDLLVFHEKPEDIIPELCTTYEVNSIYLQREWTKEEKDTEDNLKTKLGDHIRIKSYYNQLLFHPDDIKMDVTQIPQVFTAFRKKLEKYVSVRQEVETASKPIHNRIENSTTIPSLEDLGFSSIDIPPNTAFPFKGGETEALKRIESYFFETGKLGFYKKTRNGLLGTDYSSKLSPWLANGSLSPRSIYWKVKQFEKDRIKNQSTYWLIFELIWRDYFKYVSLKHGDKIFHLSGILNKSYDWDQNTNLIQNWIEGTTAEPFVNANMIELKRTGWMSNRGRQNVASFFAKELFLDWRIGAAYFEAMLIDYDVHSNYGNWMYVAGVGNDPRDRKFNIKMQAERYDPNHKFQRTWLQTTLF